VIRTARSDVGTCGDHLGLDLDARAHAKRLTLECPRQVTTPYSAQSGPLCVRKHFRTPHGAVSHSAQTTRRSIPASQTSILGQRRAISASASVIALRSDTGIGAMVNHPMGFHYGKAPDRPGRAPYGVTC
jgi:hypothetical protein